MARAGADKRAGARDGRGREVITAIGAASRPPGHVRIKCGRETVAVLHPSEAAGLAVGDVLSAALRGRLAAAAARSAARADAARVLARRACTARELRERLSGRGHGAEVVAAVVESLRSAGALDERALADAAALRDLGRSVASGETVRRLMGRGVSEGAARAAAARAGRDAGGEDDRAVALAFARSRLRPSLRAKPAEVQRRRLAGMLARRGHGEETIEAVVDQVLGEAPRGDA